MGQGETSSSIGMMTDEALLHTCVRLPWERFLDRYGCGLSLAVGVPLVTVAYLLSGINTLTIALLASPVAVILLNIGLRRLADFRGRRSQAELRRRHPELQSVPVPWFADTLRTHHRHTEEERRYEEDIHAAESSIKDVNGPDMILILRDTGLPHGPTHIIRVRLWQSGKAHGDVELRLVPEIESDHALEAAKRKTLRELDDEEYTSAVELLPSLTAAQTNDLDSMVIDGFPCELRLIRREPHLLVTYKCNLVVVAQEDNDHPIPRMMEQMLTASRCMSRQSLTFGWCDYSGNIGIDGASAHHV